jgi:hypothetical protein
VALELHSQDQAAGTAAHARAIAQSLNEVVAAIDQARSLGLPVSVPESLYRACLEVVARYEASTGSDDPGAPSRRRASRDLDTPGGATATQHPRPASQVANAARTGDGDRVGGGASARDVPLRRLVWQVLNPGEEFTVAEVVERLTNLGVSWAPNTVSNALGYWVSRGRLDRTRKGVYRYPMTTGPLGNLRKEDPQRGVPAERRTIARGKESRGNGVEQKQKKAM